MDNDTQKQNCYTRRKRGSLKNTNFSGNRKTPSPNKEYKILRRSPNNTTASSFHSRVSERNSPRHTDKTVKVGLNTRTEKSLASSPKLAEQVDSYAGARFHNPPSPDTLPKPPTHWLNDGCAASVSPMLNAPFLDSITVHIKGLLNVQA